MLDKYLIFYCSPTLASIKTSNLFRFSFDAEADLYDQLAAWNGKLECMEKFDAIAFGCPSTGTEQLEKSEFEPMFFSSEQNLRDKKIAQFGSYGWGDGAKLACESVICNETPDDTAEQACIQLGKVLV